MKRHFMTGALLALILAASSCTSTNEKITQESFSPPLMGWSSWNTYHVNINEELIKKQADALVTHGLKDAGYLYINVDDGFFGWRDETGKMHAHPERFPNSMRPISDYIHSLGLKAGIYSDAGDNTCGSIYDDDANGIGSGLYGHEQQDMDLYLKEWNYDFIKIDYCGGRELGLNEEKRYATICEAIKNTGRTDVSINICRWAFPGTWAKSMARSWRISPDIRPRWESVKNIIRKNLYLSAYAGEGHYNDIALLKNKELIALNQDPLGLQAYVVQHEAEEYVLVKDLEQKRGLVRAVALYNPSDTVCNFNVPFEKLEMGGTVKVRDVIQCKDLGDMTDTIRLSVSPHSVAIWRLEAEKRLEPTFYEAEWAYLPCYDDLGKNPKQIFYAASPACSGKMKVSNIGGSEENIAEWKEVYSEKGGEYDMTIYYSCDKNRKLEVSVNETKTEIKDLNSGNKEKVTSVTIPVTLVAGNNVIRMGNNFGWAPDIDCFKLSKRQ